MIVSSPSMIVSSPSTVSQAEIKIDEVGDWNIGDRRTLHVAWNTSETNTKKVKEQTGNRTDVQALW